MKLGIIGNYGATNVGDNAILKSIIEHHQHHKFLVFSANPSKTHSELDVKVASIFPLGLRSFFRHGFRRSMRDLKSVDAVIFGGGGLMQDDQPYACFLWAWQIFWVKWFDKPYFIYATGVGPLKSRIGRWLTRYVYKDAVGITVRDRLSFNTVKSLGLQTDNIEVTADPVFLLHRSEAELESRAPHTYLISLRPWLKYNAKMIATFTNFLLKLKNDKKARLIFVSMQQIKEADRQVIDPIIKRVGGELFVPANFNELLNLMRHSEFAIGMRYHFLVAALLTKTPSLAISYSHKVDSLFKNSSLEPYHLPIAELNEENLSRKMTRLSVDYNNVKVYQKRHLEQMRELASKNIDYFDGFIKILTKEHEAAKITQQSEQGNQSSSDSIKVTINTNKPCSQSSKSLENSTK